MLLDIPFVGTVHFEGLSWVTTFRGVYKGVQAYDVDVTIDVK